MKLFSIIGHTQQVKFSINNSTAMDIKRVTISLVGMFSYYAKSRSHKVETTVVSKDIEKDIPILAGTEIHGMIDLDIPSDTQPTISPDMSTIIHVKYEIQIACNVENRKYY
eukprot:TRINITY_DN5619_c0_g1_i2.p1 TRINITY_DN5619_c0_g1~~TRINITY_DN5619_c0_g1_i2.p1  ORF type:complete len:111 (+),score=4.21 TRINITY_DN5619_c0_g1_i2:46-378(+)